MKTVAVGDVHGCLWQLLDIIERPDFYGDELIFLGDLFDRSPISNGDSLVMTLVQAMQENPKEYDFNKVTVLRGNHEDALIRSLDEGKDSDIYDLWQYNGGDERFYDLLKVTPSAVEWLKSLPTYVIRGDNMFVHAGVRPGVPLEEQDEQDLLWIRDEFHDAEDHGLPYTVVHGHTPVSKVDVANKRINLDTGSFYTGKLSYGVFEDGTITVGSSDGNAGETSDGKRASTYAA